MLADSPASVCTTEQGVVWVWSLWLSPGDDRQAPGCKQLGMKEWRNAQRLCVAKDGVVTAPSLFLRVFTPAQRSSASALLSGDSTGWTTRHPRGNSLPPRSWLDKGRGVPPHPPHPVKASDDMRADARDRIAKGGNPTCTQGALPLVPWRPDKPSSWNFGGDGAVPCYLPNDDGLQPMRRRAKYANEALYCRDLTVVALGSLAQWYVGR